MLIVVFVTVFLAVAAIGVAITSGLQARAEVRKWQQRHQLLAHARNDAAWRANKEMIMH